MLRMFQYKLNSYGANNVVEFSCTNKTKVFTEEANLMTLSKEGTFTYNCILKDIKGN